MEQEEGATRTESGRAEERTESTRLQLDALDTLRSCQYFLDEEIIVSFLEEDRTDYLGCMPDGLARPIDEAHIS